MVIAIMVKRGLTGEATEKKINEALKRIRLGRPRVVEKSRKLSIASVAEEAGVSRATIHNRYPEIIDQISLYLDRKEARGRSHKNALLEKDLREKISLLKDEIKLLKKDKIMLASVNETLELELRSLRALVKSKNVRFLDPDV